MTQHQIIKKFKRKFVELSNRNSKIFKSVLKKQALFIRNKLPHTKLPDMYIAGTKKELITFLNAPTAKCVQRFFTVDKTCTLCKTHQNIQRAHSNIPGGSRYEIIKSVIEANWTHTQTPISISKIYTEIISHHQKFPIFPLCKDCHLVYDTHFKSTVAAKTHPNMPVKISACKNNTKSKQTRCTTETANTTTNTAANTNNTNNVANAPEHAKIQSRILRTHFKHTHELKYNTRSKTQKMNEYHIYTHQKL